MKLKKYPKLNLRGYWSQVLNKFHYFCNVFSFLVSALLCYNLDSNMLKCKGFLK